LLAKVPIKVHAICVSDDAEYFTRYLSNVHFTISNQNKFHSSFLWDSTQDSVLQKQYFLKNFNDRFK
jgi:hypothetical protein